MADMRRSRRPPAESAYGDVFGGPPKFSAAKPSDYAEIFASSGSIPFLDLPPAPEASDGVGFIDYSEIFGDFDGEDDFAVDYEELFGGRKKAVKSAASSNGRPSVETKFGRQAEEFIELSPEYVSKGQVACPEKNEFSSSSSNHSDDESKQFSMSYHSTISGSIDDVISGNAHITHLHAIPGYTYVIDSLPSFQDVSCDDSLNIQPNDFIPNVSRNERVNDVLEEKIALPTSSADNKKNRGVDLSMNQRDIDTMLFSASEAGPLDLKYHLRSFSNYSASSGDMYHPDIPYVGVSDITLQTQPTSVPPPYKPPPKLSANQENTKMNMHRSSRADHGEGKFSKHTLDHQVHYKVGAPKSRVRQGSAKDASSCFFDVEKDASFAVAAMKEAMEQAQARLKSAKELMERQREILHSRKKLDNREGTRYEEKEFKASEEEKILLDDTAMKPLLKEDIRMNGSALDKSKKVIEVSGGAPNHEEEGDIMDTEESHQIRQGDGFKSSKIPSKLEEVSGEWKTEKHFYKLVNNERKFRVTQEAFEKEDAEKKPKQTINHNEDVKNCSEKAGMRCEFGAGKLDRGNDSNERDDDYSKAVNLTWNEVTSKTPNTILEVRTMKDNAIKVDDGCLSVHQKGTEKLQADQEAFVWREDLKEQNTNEEAFASGESDNNVEFSNDAFKVDVDYSESDAAGEAHEHDELSGTNLTSFSCEGENKLKIFLGEDSHDANAMNVTYKTCQGEPVEEFVQVEEVYLHENSENAIENSRHQSCDEENECKLERFASASEHEKKKLNGSQLSCMQAENDLKSKAAEPCDQVKQTLERAKQEVDVIQLTEFENEFKLENETCCPDSSKVDTVDNLLEELQNKIALQTSSEHENNPKLRVLEGYHEENEKDKLNGAHENLALDGKHNILDAAKEDCRWTENKDPGDVNHAKLAKKEKVESEETAEPENEGDKERARKAEEEKEREREREREREKDRLAVERATREARERALAEARERAERIAVERITAEARQRALAESREKAEKAAAEALEKSLAEKALKEAKLRAERAAAERAMAEARERAVEKALADKAAADARKRAERLNAMSRDKGRKDNEPGVCFRDSDKDDREIKLKGNYADVPRDARFPGNPQRHGGDSESPLRCKAKLERHQRTVERAAKALAEKNMRDILAQREQAERNRLAESLDADVRRWSVGKEGNLRALLSTLQYILGPESGWQPVPLTDVITSAAVKKAYRKATLCVHPDKLQQRGANIQQKYICEKVFDLLKDAWNKFNSEER